MYRLQLFMHLNNKNNNNNDTNNNNKQKRHVVYLFGAGTFGQTGRMWTAGASVCVRAALVMVTGFRDLELHRSCLGVQMRGGS